LWTVEVELRFWVNHVLDRDVIVSNVTSRIKDELAKEMIKKIPPPGQD
jgi:small-conductance mechanosensitive channel